MQSIRLWLTTLIIVGTALLALPQFPRAQGGTRTLGGQERHNPFDRFDVGWEERCAEIDDSDSCEFRISITGAITVETAARFEKALARWDQKERLFVKLSSPGGDIAAAMKIGGIIRSSRGHTLVEGNATCASACVLVFGAGLSRIVFPGAMIGIHRPALAAVPPESDMTTVKAAADRMADQLRAYAAEMNISSRLVDDMLTVPPEDVRWLSAEDRQGYGLGFLDPVYEEEAVLDGAKRYGITPNEYRRRDSLAKSVCRVGTINHDFYGILDAERSKCADIVLATGKDPFPNDLVPISPESQAPTTK
jgi:ATP-dependent protease ClpP protease subunit